MRNFWLSTLFLSLATTLLTGCCETIHEYPEEGSAAVTLTLNVRNLTPEIYTVVDYTVNYTDPDVYRIDEWEQRQESRAFNAPQFEHYYLSQRRIDDTKWDLRLVWEIYYGSQEDVRRDEAVLLERKIQRLDPTIELPSHDVQIDLPTGQYTLLAWADYVPKGSDDDYFYSTKDMSAITSDIVLRETCENNDNRDCFSRCYEFIVDDVKYAGESRHYETTLTRPQGRYVVLASDYDDYLDLSSTPVENNNVECFYPTFLNVGYSIPEGRPNLSTENIGYDYTPALYVFDNDDMVSLADDYSFVNGSESHLILNLAVYHSSGRQISYNKNIDIPIYPDKLTIVLGKFLANSGNEGGLSISDGFENETVIQFKPRK